MDSLIVLKNPGLVREEMGYLDPRTQARGEKYFNSGRVRNLRAGPAEGEFLAEVQGTELYAVRVLFDDDGLAEESCSCPVGEDCKHLYATLKALLVAHTQDSVQALSARQTPVVVEVKAKAKQEDNRTFPEQVLAALGRPLLPKEKSFLTRLTQLHAQCRQTGKITHWDFQQLGLPLGGYGWDALKIWPAFPETLRQFWAYVAHAANERGLVLPAFLQPVTDFSEIEEALRRWRREQEITRWKSALGQSPTELAGGGVVRRVDLRAVLHERAASLEWQPDGQPAFAAIKLMQARELQRQLRAGEVEFMPGAEWVWQAFERRIDYAGRTDLEYYEEEAQRLLASLFRMSGTSVRLVNASGEPFQFAAEPLRWHLDPAASEDEDYRVRLVQADGSTVPPVLCVLGHRTPLYITNQIIFRGPTAEAGALNPRAENLIPAPALESIGGVAMLHALGVELPPRLRERVRIVPLNVHLTCQLRPMYPGSNLEVCAIQAHTATPEGRLQENWNGHVWEPKKPSAGKGTKKSDTITVHDRHGVGNPSSLVAPLAAKWEGYRDGFAVRVTKKFPDLFASWLKSLPPEVRVDLKGDLASFLEGSIAGSVKLDVTETEIDWFDLRVVLDVNDTTLTPEELKLLLNARGGYVRLEGKGWRRLQFNLTDEEDEQLARLGLNPRELTAEPQRLHALQLADTAAKKFLSEPQYERIERRAGEIKARVTPDLPATIKADLRPYQLEGFHFLAYLAANNFGGILADDMGLGKTLQTLTWLEYLRANVPPAPSLVVCPKSVMDNWRAEAERFVPGLRVKVWSPSELKNFSARLADADLHVLNYSQLRLLGENLTSARWLALILDEGQYIKNPSSITAQIARSLRAERRLVLSGTPIENRLLDLWSLMAFAMPGALGSRAQFAKLYDAKEDPHARRRLAARVRPFLLRRTKGQVAKDLPDRSEEDLFCEIEGEQKTLYRAEMKRAQQMLLRVTTQKQLAQDRFHILTSLLRLRQICCHPKLVKPDSTAPSAKVEALLEQLEPIIEEGHKVLVFSQFVDMLDILREAITARGWPTFYLAGATENRGELVKDFQATEGASVFLISLKAGGFGLNLTAASYVVLFDPWWNPAVENQAIDRTHRIGQARNVIAYRLLIKNSIEEKIRALQKKKSTLASDVLGEEKFAQSLTLDDLRYLFTDDAPVE